MGASTSFRRFKADLGLDKIKQLWTAAVEQSLYEDGHQYSGEIGMLGSKVAKWHEPAFEGPDAENQAYTFIEEHHEKWRPALAVSFIKNGEKYWLIGGWCSS
jgi:hypothetical protein